VAGPFIPEPKSRKSSLEDLGLFAPGRLFSMKRENLRPGSALKSISKKEPLEASKRVSKAMREGPGLPKLWRGRSAFLWQRAKG